MLNYNSIDSHWFIWDLIKCSYMYKHRPYSILEVSGDLITDINFWGTVLGIYLQRKIRFFNLMFIDL